MAEGKRRRWIKWVIWTPCVLALVGIGALLYADHSLGAQIQSEEALLLKLGVDVREATPEMAAATEYEAIAKAYLPLKKSEERNFLERVELASKRPLLNLPTEDGPSAGEEVAWTRIQAALHDISNRALLARDWPTYELVDRIEVGQMGQRIAEGNFGGFALGTPMDLPEWCKDPEAREQVRRQLLAPYTKRWLQGKLTGFGRSMRKANYDSSKSSTASLSFWRKAMESQTTFRKGAELAMLRQLRMNAEMALNMETLNGLSVDLPSEVSSGLRREGTVQAQSALDRMNNAGYPQFQSFMIFRIRLIQIDLCESREKGKPLVPTWSKVYCYDPQLNAQIKVTPDKKGVVLDTFQPGSSGWTIRFDW